MPRLQMVKSVSEVCCSAKGSGFSGNLVFSPRVLEVLRAQTQGGFEVAPWKKQAANSTTAGYVFLKANFNSVKSMLISDASI